MAPGREIAAAYIALIPSAQGIKSNLERELAGPARQAGQTAGRAIEDGVSEGADRGGRRAAASLTQLVGSAAILAGLNKAREAASNLQQAVGGTVAVFGQASAAVDDFAETAADSVGLSQQAARELTSQLGASLKGFGFAVDEAADKSIELTRIGADLAATFGGTTAEAVGALSSALRGEFDPLERFGIALRQSTIDLRAQELGLVEVGAEIDALSRAQAALSLITEQAGGAIGQFGRESETAAGQAARAQAQAEDAAAEFGEAILPVYAKIQSGIALVAGIFADLPEAVQSGLVVLAGAVAVSGPIATAGRLFGDMASSSGRLSTALTRLGPAAGAAGIAFAGLGTAAAIWSGAMDDARESAAALGETAADSFSGRGFTETLEQIDAVLDAADDLRREAGETAGNPINADYAAGLREGADALEETAIGQERAIDAARAYSDVLGGSVDAGLEAIRASEDYAGVLSGELPTAAAGSRIALERLQGAVDDTNTALETAKTRAQEAADALTGSFSTGLRLEELALRTQDANLAVEDAARGLADGTVLQEEYDQAVRDAAEAANQQAEATVDLFQQQAELRGETLDATDQMAIFRTVLQDIADDIAPGADLRVRLDEMIFLLGAVEGEHRAVITAETAAAEAAVAALNTAVQNLTADPFQIAIQAVLTGDTSAFQTPSDPTTDALLEALGLEPRATGGPMVAGQSYLFEGHPEILTMGPSMSSGQVTPLADVALSTGSGGGITLNANGHYFSPGDLLERAREELGWAMSTRGDA